MSLHLLWGLIISDEREHFRSVKSPLAKFSTGGNPAAVCLLEKDLPDETKQKLAMEMNLSETAFVVPIDEAADEAEPFKSGKRFSLRWFTPVVEVPLCGHATLASAAVLFYVIGNQQVGQSPSLWMRSLLSESTLCSSLLSASSSSRQAQFQAPCTA